MEPALRLQRLTKTFGETRAVDEMDLVVPRGATYGFIGPSGAGKTTCIRMICRSSSPTQGSCRCSVASLRSRPRIASAICRKSAVCTARMKVGDFLSLHRAAQRRAGGRGAAARDGAAGAHRLVDVEKKKCEELSKGMLHRVEFVAAIINRPELIILDEPFSGLDPVSVKLLKELVAGSTSGSDDSFLDAHHGARRGALPAHRHDSPGPKVLDEPMTGCGVNSIRASSALNRWMSTRRWASCVRFPV
jgi:ABC-2 type transport system ATP-binding protein